MGNVTIMGADLSSPNNTAAAVRNSLKATAFHAGGV